MGSAADCLNVARSFLGIRENPDGSNLTPIGEEYGNNGVAWCDQSCSVCLRRIGLAPGPIDDTHFQSCWYHNRAYKRGDCGTWLGNPGADGLRPGDQGFLGTTGEEHTFWVEAVDGSHVLTLEGNIGNAYKRNRRSIGSIYGFGRPNYDEGTVPGSPPSATEGRPILRLGSRGDGVKTWQLIVGVNVDGDFGAATDTATKVFQTKIGVTADGEVGPATWAATDRLLAYLAAASAGGGQPAPKPGAPDFVGTTRKGTGNHPVTMLVQAHLNDLGYNAGAVDGIFGAGTDAAVRHFQGDHGLTRDGVVGPQTWSALWTA